MEPFTTYNSYHTFLAPTKVCDLNSSISPRLNDADNEAAQDVDATQYGNKLRFINHSKAARNCGGKLLFVNGVQRIALFSTRPIEAGEELFFDYGPEFHVAFLSKEPKRKGARKPDPKTPSRMVASGTAEARETEEAVRARLGRRRKRESRRDVQVRDGSPDDSRSSRLRTRRENLDRGSFITLPYRVEADRSTIPANAQPETPLHSSVMNWSEAADESMVDRADQIYDNSSEREFMNSLANAASAEDDENDSDYVGPRRRRGQQIRSSAGRTGQVPRDSHGRYQRLRPRKRWV